MNRYANIDTLASRDTPLSMAKNVASQYGSSHPNVGIIFRRVPIPMLNAPKIPKASDFGPWPIPSPNIGNQTMEIPETVVKGHCRNFALRVS